MPLPALRMKASDTHFHVSGMLINFKQTTYMALSHEDSFKLFCSFAVMIPKIYIALITISFVTGRPIAFVKGAERKGVAMKVSF